jgi:DNA-directed RNA polymerase alpha subunit
METDGMLTGQEASDIAAHILVDHFTMMFSSDFAKVEAGAVIEPAIEEVSASIPAEEMAENEITSSTLSTRAKNALVKNGITTMAALQALSDEQVGKLSGLGEKTIKEILEFLGR